MFYLVPFFYIFASYIATYNLILDKKQESYMANNHFFPINLFVSVKIFKIIK